MRYDTKPAVLLVPAGSYSSAPRVTSRKRRARQLTCAVRFVRLFNRAVGWGHSPCALVPAALVPARARTCPGSYLPVHVPARARTCPCSYSPALVPARARTRARTCSCSYLLELVPMLVPPPARTCPSSYLLELAPTPARSYPPAHSYLLTLVRTCPYSFLPRSFSLVCAHSTSVPARLTSVCAPLPLFTLICPCLHSHNS